MAIEVFNRYEYKYLLDKETYEKVMVIMNEHMNLDLYNIGGKAYTISNIYYDTPDDFLIRTSLSSPLYKEKLRLRSYGIPQISSKVFLEIKKKYQGLVNKRRTTLILDEAYDFVEKGKAPKQKEYMNAQVVSEIEYFLNIYDLEPKLFLAYDRIAYFSKESDDLRISFDTNIRSRRYDLGLEMGDYGSQLLDIGVYLMEIKTALAMPLWLTHMLAELGIKRSSFSKYGTEFMQYISGDGGYNYRIAV